MRGDGLSANHQSVTDRSQIWGTDTCSDGCDAFRIRGAWRWPHFAHRRGWLASSSSHV